MSFKRYKSVFSESKKVNKKLSLRKESILNRFKRVLREEDLNPSDVEDIVGKIEEVITDVIGDHGVDNPVIDELSSTVKAINMQNRMTSDIDMMESRLNNKFRKLRKESMDDMYDDEMDSMEMDDMYDEPVESFDTGYDMSMEDDEFMYDADSIMEAEEDDEEEMDDEEEKKESYKKARRMIRETEMEDEDEEEMEEAYDDEEDEEKIEESYKRKKRIAEMKRKLREAEEDEDEEEMEEAYDDEEEDEMKEEAESDEGDNLIDYDNGSDYDYLSSIDSEGNYSSSRGMDADMDDNRE
jgi:hypothetical protein